MSYTLEEFCADCHEIPKTDPMADGRERIRRKLEELSLTNIPSGG